MLVSEIRLRCLCQNRLWIVGHAATVDCGKLTKLARVTQWVPVNDEEIGVPSGGHAADISLLSQVTGRD